MSCFSASAIVISNVAWYGGFSGVSLADALSSK